MSMLKNDAMVIFADVFLIPRRRGEGGGDNNNNNNLFTYIAQINKNLIKCALQL